MKRVWGYYWLLLEPGSCLACALVLNLRRLLQLITPPRHHHFTYHCITLHYITTDHTPLIITLHYITLQLITAPRHHHFTYHWAPQRLHADHNTSQARMKVGRPILIVAIFVAYHQVRPCCCVVSSKDKSSPAHNCKVLTHFWNFAHAFSLVK